jgi:putative inorganic carbon (hco3(-)) transporter
MKVSQILIGLFIISFPFQENIYVRGFSMSFIAMGLLSLYVFFNHYGRLKQIISHSKIVKYFVYFLIGISIIEFLHPNASIANIIRVGYILISSIMIVSIMYSKKNLIFIANAYVISGIFVGLNLVFFGYSILLGGNATSFNDASIIRDRIVENISINQDINNLAFNQGLSSLLGAVFFFISDKKRKKYFYLVALLITFMGMIVTMSRGGLITVIGTVVFTIYYFKISVTKKILFPILFLFILVLVTPSAYFSRFNINLSKDVAKQEGRARVFNSSVDALVDEGLLGVGEGNYWSVWGKSSKLAKYYGQKIRVIGTHNLFFQITLNWGIIGILLFLMVIYTIISYRPSRYNNDTESYLFIVVFISSLLYMAQIHNLQTKDFIILYSFGIIQEFRIRSKRQL